MAGTRNRRWLVGGCSAGKTSLAGGVLANLIRLALLRESAERVSSVPDRDRRVGPRPEPHERVKHYSMWQRQRLTVTPGLTGLAQVNGLREQHSSEEKVHFDLQYISHWSLFLDLSLVLQTTWTLLLRLVHQNRLATRPLRKPTIDTHLGIGKIWNANRTQSRAH